MVKFSIEDSELDINNEIYREAIANADDQMIKYRFNSASSAEVLQTSTYVLACVCGVFYIMDYVAPTGDELNDLAYLIHSWTVESFRLGHAPKLSRIVAQG